MSSPRQYPIHKSLTDPILAWGGEWFLVWPWWLLIVAAIWVTLVTQTRLTVIVLIVGFLGQKGLQQLAKIDPLWSKVFWRVRRYKPYYGPHTKTGGR